LAQSNPTYVDGDLRRELLDAAAQAVALQGPAAVSLRALAREVGVSHAAPAHHFGDKTGLFTALAAEGFLELGTAVSAATLADTGTDTQADTESALVAGAVAYVRFATERRGHFEVMWRTDLLHLGDPSYLAAAAAAFDTLHDAVRRAQGRGWRRAGDTGELTIAAWAVVHGLASLHNAGILQMVTAGREPAELAETITSLLVSALASSAGRSASE
jgi:AcrR family transcriptional regulator